MTTPPSYTPPAPRRGLPKLLLLCAAALLTCRAPQATGQVPTETSVTSEQVAGAIDGGIAFLRSRQLGNGGWPESRYVGGTTALALLTMLNAGVDVGDPAVRHGLQHLVAVPNRYTYVVALKCMALAAADPKGYAREIHGAARWLWQAQQDSGTWGYTPGRSGYDHSNTQFALLGLHEAAKAGVQVPTQTWRRSQRHFLLAQQGDGGWAYRQSGASYGSMTCAGLASLLIAEDRLHVARETGFAHGAAAGCGRYARNAAIAHGIRWLSQRFSVQENPRRKQSFLHYYLYALERVGMTGGLRYIGQHDWYRQGAAFLVATQHQGAWDGSVANTCFALLFLAKGNRPVLIQKLQWSGLWNLDRHDVPNLVAFIGDKLGKKVTWQTVSLQAPVTDWLAAPILYFQGHSFPKFTDAEVDKIKQFVDNGGTLLAEACCGRPAFRDGFVAFAKRAFAEYSLRKLPMEHPVFHSYHTLDRTHGLMGVDVGCRTSVFFLPNDVSCLWEQRRVRGAEALTAFAFRLGVNLGAYATGLEPLGDKLTEVQLPQRSPAATVAAARGAVQVARLVHNGDYNADPHALAHLTELAAQRARIDVVTRDVPLAADDKAIFDHPILFMTGHFSFTMADDQIELLAKHLQRGGMLIAEACCGRKTFDESFRALAKRLLAEQSGAQDLLPLPADHPIYTGQVGLPLGPVRLRARLAEELNRSRLDRPKLLAGRIEGRIAILYSPYDWSCGLEGDKPYACRGYSDEDARHIGLNLLLYAVSY